MAGFWGGLLVVLRPIRCWCWLFGLFILVALLICLCKVCRLLFSCLTVCGWLTRWDVVWLIVLLASLLWLFGEGVCLLVSYVF